MDNLPPASEKQGLGPLAWIGIGCGSVIALAIVAVIVFSMMFGGKITQFMDEAQKNPTRATAMAMVKMSAGQFEMVAEDDANKRYTVKQKQNGQLTTIYWDEKKQAPEVIPGDFSAIPPQAPDATPAPEAKPAPDAK